MKFDEAAVLKTPGEDQYLVVLPDSPPIKRYYQNNDYMYI